MTHKLECRLPPINTLALDFPLSLPQPVYGQNFNSPQHHLHGLSSPQINATSYGGSGAIPQANLYNPYANPAAGAVMQNAPNTKASSISDSETSGSQGYFSGHNSSLAEYTLSQPKPVAHSAFNSPVSAVFGARNSTGSVESLTGHFIQQPSPSSSRKSSSPSPLARDHVLPPQIHMTPEADLRAPVPNSVISSGSVYATADASKSPDSTKDLKRRKKRQCPECNLFFSNLATHKSTHLNPTARPHICNVCSRGFARPNDLFRHYKCHWKETGTGNGQFRCPFKSGGHENQCSHPSGIFSRCDTYKNHLKAIHFDYPGGTRKSDRGTSPGRCGSCQKQFSSVDEWLVSHVDTHSCELMKE